MTMALRDRKKQNQLTTRQKKVLAFLRKNCRMYGPTVREIGKALAISSPNGVVCHLSALEKKGFVKRYRRIARGIEVLK